MTAEEWFKLLCSPLHWVSLAQSIMALPLETSGAQGTAQTGTPLRAAVSPSMQEHRDQLNYPPPHSPVQCFHFHTRHSLEVAGFLFHREALGSRLPTLRALCFAPVISSAAQVISWTVQTCTQWAQVLPWTQSNLVATLVWTLPYECNLFGYFNQPLKQPRFIEN